MDNLESANLPFITSVGPMTIAELAAAMLRQARVAYRFDADGSDVKVHEQAIGLGWHGPLLMNLNALAGSAGLEVKIEENIIRFLKGVGAEK